MNHPVYLSMCLFWPSSYLLSLLLYLFFLPPLLFSASSQTTVCLAIALPSSDLCSGWFLTGCQCYLSINSPPPQSGRAAFVTYLSVLSDADHGRWCCHGLTHTQTHTCVNHGASQDRTASCTASTNTVLVRHAVYLYYGTQYYS